MKNKTTVLLLIMLIAAITLFAYFFPREAKPIIKEDGSVAGNYSIKQIMSLGNSYVCTFEKSDETSVVVGTIHTNSKNIYGEFRILTSVLETEFNSYLLTQGNESYVWTSLQPVGQKSKVAKSANINATPEEQTQIIGKTDKVDYDCKPWEEDKTVFEVPSWINFVEVE
jgi:hypothetical protein